MQTAPNIRTGNGGPPAGAPAPRASRMSLSAGTKGRIEKPLRVLLYGTEGIGKSTWGAGAPKPKFLCAEAGTERLDIDRFPEPTSWDDVFDAIRALEVEPHDYKTLVVDTVDWIEPLCWRSICEKGSKTSIEDFGYSKGYIAALDEWRRFLAALERLRAKRNLWIVLLAHAQVKTWKNPTGEDFDRYQLKLHEKAAGLVKEWCDAVLFVEFETLTIEKEKSKRIQGVSGARVVHTQRTAAWDAKNRHDLPEKMPLSWEDFEKAVREHKPADPAALLAEIAALRPQAGLTEDEAAKMDALLGKAANDAASLAKIKDRLAAKIASAAAPQTTTEGA